jgi:hypothetical protein
LAILPLPTLVTFLAMPQKPEKLYQEDNKITDRQAGRAGRRTARTRL